MGFNKYCRMICSTTNASYIYRDLIVESMNEVTYLHYHTNENYTRAVRNSYTLSVKDNEIDKNDQITIFSNIHYITEVIKKRVLNIFPAQEYEGLESSFELSFDVNTKLFKLTFDYELMDNLTPNSKNIMVCEILVGTLLDAAKELSDNSEEAKKYSSFTLIDEVTEPV